MNLLSASDAEVTSRSDFSTIRQARPHIFKHIQRIFTLRGVLLLSFALYLFFVPAVHEADIIASVVSLFLLGSLLSIFLLSAVQGPSISNRLQLSFSTSQASSISPEEELYANMVQENILRISPRRLFPAFFLELHPVFEHEEFTLPPLVISGSDRSTAFFPLHLFFPHRGVWKLLRVDCALRDQFGFTAFKWRLDCQHAYEVKPRPVDESRVPVVASCHRSGDIAVDVTTRQGDPFDLKRYHPSDGIKKILWKVYAKSQQLISRHPEASYTPEGQVALFVIADEKEDAPCSEAVAYMKLLKTMELEPFLAASTFPPGVFSRTPEEALRLLVETAWEQRDPETSLRDFVAVMRDLLKDVRLERMVLFVSHERLADSIKVEEIKKLGVNLSIQGIEPVFVVPESSGSIIAEQPSSLFDLLVYRKRPQKIPAHLPDEFLNLCSQNRWELIVPQ